MRASKATATLAFAVAADAVNAAFVRSVSARAIPRHVVAALSPCNKRNTRAHQRYSRKLATNSGARTQVDHVLGHIQRAIVASPVRVAHAFLVQAQTIPTVFIFGADPAAPRHVAQVDGAWWAGTRRPCGAGPSQLGDRASVAAVVPLTRAHPVHTRASRDTGGCFTKRVHVCGRPPAMDVEGASCAAFGSSHTGEGSGPLEA